MAKALADFLAFNRGLVSPLALARTDVERTRLSAATMVNWLPKTQGAMRLRPGSKYLGSSYGDLTPEYIPFIASVSDTALLELTNARMRVLISDVLLTRPVVTTAISNSTFTSGTGWTDASTSGGAATFNSGPGLTLNATKLGGIAKVTRQVTVVETGTEHSLAINVTRGPFIFRVGSTAGGEEYISEMDLRTGYHSLAFTPTGDFYITISNEDPVNRIVASLAMEASGVVSLTTPWLTANLTSVRYSQSADVVFLACYGLRQMRIERRGTGRSWSVVNYTPENGPFEIKPSSSALITVGATYGNTTLTSTKAFFNSGHVGALFRLLHDGQGGVYVFAAANTYSDVWKVQGVGSATERRSTIVTAGTFTANIQVQRSYTSSTDGFRTVQTITTATSTNVDDVDDNVTVYYRLAIPIASDFTSGTCTATVTYLAGSKDGVCRVVSYSSPTVVNVEVLSRFSSATVAATDWAEEMWSDSSGWPSSVELHEGRLWWFGGTKVFGSVSDDYENWNAGTVGDSGPIERSLSTGPVNRINFAVSLTRLFIGTDGEEVALRSTSLDEPLTPSNMSAKTSSTQGSMNLRAIKIDDRAVFVNRAGKRVFMIAYDTQANDFSTKDLTLLVPDTLSGVVSIAVQRQPDTRIICVLDDGTVAIATYEAQEQVLCWYFHYTTAASGFVEKVVVLPGSNEDAVYFHVKRTINGSTKRYLERQATEAESVGASVSWMMDCGLLVSQASSTTISGLSHLEGQKVIVWASGVDLSPDVSASQTTYTVTGGAITVSTAVTSATVGLPYQPRTVGTEVDAQWKSVKLAYASQAGSALTMPKRVDHLGVILGTCHNNGLFYGKSLDVTDLQPLPRKLNEREITNVDEIFDGEEFTPFPFPGDFSTDSRFCLAAKAPRPCTLLAAVIGLAEHDVI